MCAKFPWLMRKEGKQFFFFFFVCIYCSGPEYFTLKYVKVIFLIFDINRLKLLKTLKKYQFQT
jgi:hypothetical protein